MVTRKKATENLLIDDPYLDIPPLLEEESALSKLSGRQAKAIYLQLTSIISIASIN